VTSAIWGDPGNLRLVVLDLETVVAPDNAHRIVALGVVVCRGRIGSLGQQSSWLVNPECPVDRFTLSKHGLTNDHLADQPTFDEVWPAVAPLLAARPGETTVLAAHYAPFDVPTLRAEVARIGSPLPLPDLPVLDTHGPILELAGLTPVSRSLEWVLSALGLVNAKHHDALADATATAEAARILIERAEAAGHADLWQLLVDLGNPSTATVRAAGRPAGPKTLAVPTLPETHLARHATVFPERPTAADLAAWTSFVAECAALHCDHLAGQGAMIPAPAFRPMLLSAIAGTADPTAVATALGALARLLDPLPDSIAEMRFEVPGLVRLPGKRGTRGVAMTLAAHLDRLLAGVPRCPDDRPCPACREGQPCPRDAWPQAMVPSVFSGTEASAVSLWNPRGLAATPQSKGAGRGYLSVRKASPGYADAAIRAAHAFWREQGDPGTAASLAGQVWAEGCRDPGIAEARALLTATSGRQADLALALADCEAVLATRAGNTDQAWSSLAITAEMLSGRLGRLANPTVRRHHPTNPVRPPRPARFLRGGQAVR